MESAQNNKYANGKIYRISCNITGLCYVGSTTKTLSERLRGHENSYNSYLKGKSHYVTSFDILKNDDYQITLLQAYPCENKQELFDREGWYQKKYWDRSVNKVQNGKTDDEKKIDKQEYYQDTKIEHNKKCKKNYKANKENILNSKKEYYQKNKEMLKAKRNYYYNKNKAKINQNHICACGGKYSQNKARHEKSLIHQDWIKNN